MKRSVLFRADGNNKIGFGHVMRCLAFAETLKGEYHLTFATSVQSKFIIEQILSVCNHIIQLPLFDYKIVANKNSTEEIPFDLDDCLNGNEIVITDGYWFGSNYQKKIKHKGCKLICIDDLAIWHFVSDVVINHAPGLSPEQYSTEPGTKLFLGLDYMILREEFFAPVTEKKDMLRSVYVCLGGADYANLSLKIIEEVININTWQMHILISGAYSEELQFKIKDFQCSYANIEVHKDITASGIVGILDKCSHAIVSASTVALECIARGIKPMIGYYTDNQKFMYRGLIKEGYAYGLGDLNTAINSSLISENLQRQSYIDRPLLKSTPRHNLLNIIVN